MPKDSASPGGRAASGGAARGRRTRGCAAHRQGGGGGGGLAAEPLKLEEDDKFWRDNGGADLESALQVDPEHGDSPVALIDARYIVELWSAAARSSAGRTSQRRRFSTSRRSSGCLLAGNTATACASSPSRTRGSSPTIPTRRRSTSRYSPRCSSGLSRPRGRIMAAGGLHLRVFL